MCRGAATIRCLSTSSVLSRRTRRWQPANCSTPRSASGRVCNIIATPPPQPSAMKSRTSRSTTTSPLTSSVSARTSNTSASPSASSSLIPTALRLCGCSARRRVTAGSRPPTSPGEYPLSFTPTGAKAYRPVPTSRSSTCSTPLRLGKICKASLPKSRSAGNSPSLAVFLRLTQLIIPFLITLRFSKESGITSNSLSASPKRRS